MSSRVPKLSVIVPLDDDPASAAATFEALLASDLARDRWELIAVATTQSAVVIGLAAQVADAVVRVGGQWSREAPYLCNRGAAAACGGVLVFINTDIIIASDTLSRIDGLFADPGLGAIGTILTAPTPLATVATRYRRLAIDWSARRRLEPPDRFDARCVAVRTPAFFDGGQLDEWQSASLDRSAIDLGARIRALGYRTEIRTDIRVQSRQPTTWRDAAEPMLPGAPRRDRWLSAAIWLAAIAGIAAAWMDSGELGRAAIYVALGVLIADLPLLIYLARSGGPVVVCAAVPLRAATLLAYGGRRAFAVTRSRVLGEPHADAGLEALAEVGARAWPPPPTRAPARHPNAS